jgi:hypothetical protein
MWSFSETNNIRNNLKMHLSNYSWYLGSYVTPGFEGYSIQVDVSRIDSSVINAIPSRIRRTWIKVYLRSGGEEQH